MFLLFSGILGIILFYNKKSFTILYGSFQLCLVLQFTYILLLVQSLCKMVDFLTNRAFNSSYNNNFSSRPNEEPQKNETLSSLSTLRRYTQDQKYRKNVFRHADANVRDKQLFNIKENSPDVQLSIRRPFNNFCCQNCTLTSRQSLVKKTTENLALINILNYKIPYKKVGFTARLFPHLYQANECKKFPYPQVENLVLKDDRVKKAIEKAAIQQFQDSENDDDEYYQELIENNKIRAKKLVHDMRSTLSDFLLRFTSWILYKLLPCFLTSVSVHPGQVDMLKEASKTNLPLIFLPLHRSHLDYILLSFILLNNDIRSPLVAAGDNLKIPFFGSLLRSLGAFFIKRRIDPVMGRKDYVYKAVLHTYMNLCLRAGHNIEFFLEGGRTRTGKPCMPKYGILSVIVETFMDGTIEDALLVPVSINYEKLIDGNFVKEQLGQPKKMETFGDAFKGIWHVLNSKYGMMRVDFNQPFSLRELIQTFNNSSNNTIASIPTNNRMLKSKPSTNSLYGTDVVSDEHKSLVEMISKHVIYDCAQSSSIMATNALAFLLLTKFRNGIDIESLIYSFEELKKDLSSAGKEIGFCGDSIDVINYAITLFGPALVRKEKSTSGEELVKPIIDLPNVIELNYYSNSLVTHFALQSVICLAISRCLRKKSSTRDNMNNSSVTHEDVLENSLELCSIFQYEFLFCKPCQNLEQSISECIDELTLHKEIILNPESETNELIRRSRKFAAEFDDDEENEQEIVKTYDINVTKLETIHYYAQILMPILETYAVTGSTMERLIHKQLLEDEMIEEILEEMKNQLEIKTIHYGESLSVDSIKNALRLYQNWDVLECHQEYKVRMYSLKESYDNLESVQLFYERINQYRLVALESPK